MRVLYFDAFAGISGDMTVGALVSLGVNPRVIETELAGLLIGGYEVQFSPKGDILKKQLLKKEKEEEKEENEKE